jgi:hypothetical protein
MTTATNEKLEPKPFTRSSTQRGWKFVLLCAVAEWIGTYMRLFVSRNCFWFVPGKAVLRAVACDQVPGARGSGQGTETLSAAWRLAA